MSKQIVMFRLPLTEKEILDIHCERCGWSRQYVVETLIHAYLKGRIKLEELENYEHR